MNMIKKRFALLSALGLLFFACKQSPIFYEISLEVPPIEPMIGGMPTNIVQIGETIYAASRLGDTVYQYNGSAWLPLTTQPGGSILELAATSTTLYALTGMPASLTLRKFASSTWSEVSGTSGRNVQAIYGAGEYLFAGAVTDSSASRLICSILCVKDDESSLSELQADISLLKGAVYDETTSTYYLVTAGSGIFTLTDPSSGSPTQQSTNYNNIVGIIQVDDKIVAVSRDGYILHGTAASGFTAVGTDASFFTGALAVYEKDSTHLLLLGIQAKGSTSTVHGYREILLKSDGTLDTDQMALRKPGAYVESSVDDYEQYVVTIGKQPLSSIIQAPNGRLFAATTKGGLWSYKVRSNGETVWNAED
jgi:hypothetical protein